MGKKCNIGLLCILVFSQPLFIICRLSRCVVHHAATSPLSFSNLIFCQTRRVVPSIATRRLAHRDVSSFASCRVALRTTCSRRQKYVNLSAEGHVLIFGVSSPTLRVSREGLFELITYKMFLLECKKSFAVFFILHACCQNLFMVLCRVFF